MNIHSKILAVIGLTFALSACGGSSSGASSGGSVTPDVTKVSGVAIGNISAIPGNGNQTSTALVVTNNSKANLILRSGTITQGSDVKKLNVSSSSNGSTSYGLVNVSQCATLQADGTCSISIVVPANTNGNYLLTLNFTDGTHTYTSNQVVAYTNTIPTVDGFTYSNLNNNLYNMPGGSTTYAIPFILDHDYTTLYSYTSNPAFSSNIICPGGAVYTKGDLCTVYVRVSNLGTNPRVTATVTVSTQPNPNAQANAHKSKAGIKAATGYSFSTSVTVANTAIGNLVSSAFNVVINPANGASPESVILLNNGSETVSNISIIPVGGVISIANSGPGSCATGVGGANSLSAGASCGFSVNANTLSSGSNAVNVTYNNGASSGNTNGITSFTVVYISESAGPGMSMTAGQGSLQNAVVGFTSALNIQVSNTGNVPFTNVGFTNITSVYGSQFTYNALSSTCKTDGSQALPIGGQCTLVVDYLPTVAQTTPQTLNINSSAKYTDPNNPGESLTYNGSTFGTSYSAFLSNAFVYMTPNSVSYAIRADGSDTQSQTITVANFGGQSATLSSPSYNESGLSSISSTIHVTDNCAGVTLLANNGNTCTLNVVYGPTPTAQPLTSGYFFVPYSPISGSAKVNAFSAQIFQAESAALITVSGPVESGAQGGSGSGTSVSPYTFYNSPSTGRPIILTYTYTNNGTAAASNFVVSLNSLPLGWTISGLPTCGYGATSSTLAASASCTVAITAISAGTFWNPYASTGAINVVTPGYSYTDPNTGFNSGPATTTTTYVNPMLFASVSSNNPTSSTATSGGGFNESFTASLGGDSTGFPITISIPTTSLPVGIGSGAPIYLTSTSSCTISAPGGSCSLGISNVAGAVATTYYYQYWVTPNGLTPSASNSIIQYFGFTLN